ncbi:tRNA dihydrouridine synthase DusB [Calditrichota bacterium]
MKIGNINITNGVFLAPMEDVSDYPFRMICKRMGADVLYSEFISSEALIRDAKKAFKKMTILPQEHPIGIQIFGNRVEAMVKAAQIAEEKEPDFIDINFGCPVKKVALKGAGAGLLRDIPLMIKICEEVVKNTSLPVTAKTRLGWDADEIVIIEVAKKMEAVGIEALALHARTRAQGYKGTADWNWIAKTKQSVNIPVIGNGDITEPEQVKEMFDQTNCDAVMIGRGAIHKPWIFMQAKDYLKTGKIPPEPSLNEKIYLLILHLNHSVEHKGERRGVLEMRKHYSGYLKGIPDIVKFRLELMQFTKLDPIINKLQNLIPCAN